MRRNYRSMAVLAVVLALVPAAALGRLNVGDQAPNFSLPDTAGNSHQLTEWAGRCVLLNFWQSG